MITNFLRLIRIQNLIIVAFTQYMIRYFVILPLLKDSGFESQFSEINFLLLVLSTVLLTAAGYVINDYFDTKTDMINRPKKVVIGVHFHRRFAIILHVVLNTIGIILGFYVSYKIQMPRLVFIFIFITALLWFYSSYYKRKFLVGNLIVAVLTALVPLMPVLYEIPPLNRFYVETLIIMKTNFMFIFVWVAGFSIFAFLTTFTREIIKDVEDFEGDNEFGRKTLPVVLGIKKTKIIIISLISSTIILLTIVYFRFLFYIKYSTNDFNGIDLISLIYIFIFIILPYLILIYKIFKSKNTIQWHTNSLIAKIIMLLGILYTLVIFYNLSSI